MFSECHTPCLCLASLVQKGALLKGSPHKLCPMGRVCVCAHVPLGSKSVSQLVQERQGIHCRHTFLK